MFYLKKYFTEGLIQMAILLSLCGVRVDVNLEPYLPPSWHEIILGPTLALTQTQFHNLRNCLEDDCDLLPKNVDLDGFFTARWLLGWVRSLDRLQVPHAELETWLVQREPDPPDQTSLLERTSAAVVRDRSGAPVEPRPGLGALQEQVEVDDKEEGTHHVLHHNGALDERGEEEEDEEEDLARMHRNYRRTGGGLRPGGDANNRELTQNEVDQGRSATQNPPFPHSTPGQRPEISFSLQECLRLLEESFPITEEQQLSDAGGRRGDLECQPPSREPLLSPIIPTDNSLDLELHWQDIFAIMEPENTDAGMMTSSDHILDASPSGSEALQQDCNNLDNSITDANQQACLMETPLHHALLWSPSQPEIEPALLPLIPTAELDDHSPAFDTSNSNMNIVHSPPDYMDLLGEDTSEDFCMGQNSTININLLAPVLVDNVEGSPCLEYADYPGDPTSFDFNFHLHDLTPSSSATSMEGNDMIQDLVTLPSSVSLVDKEYVVDEDGLSSPLIDLLKEAAILDEIRLLDLSLEEGFSPELEVRLKEEGYHDCERAKEETSRDNDNSVCGMAVTEDQSEPGRHQQDSEDEADSDSGLSLDFSHSPASPCASEASYYSSSSSSSSTSSSSCASAVGSFFHEDVEEDAEEGLVGSDMDVEVTIKQEELEEEEMGAVGGGYPEDVKKFLPANKLLNGYPWLEHIDHDHTYNQPWSSTSSPSLGKMQTKHTKSSPQHHNPRHYHHSSSRHISETKMWSRDERRARTLKIPFSNELIINLPVEEFNDLLTSSQLNEEQLTLVRDIRRRGKNKIAAQNCRKRKLNVLVRLEDDVSGLKCARLRLLREKQDTLTNLQEMKRRLGILYKEVFSRLRDEDGRPLDATEYLLHFGHSGSVRVASRQQEAWTGEKTSKKRRNKKK